MSEIKWICPHCDKRNTMFFENGEIVRGGHDVLCPGCECAIRVVININVHTFIKKRSEASIYFENRRQNESNKN